MLDFPLPASVLFSLFHLLAQHYCTSVTTGSYKRPYRPVRPLVITKAVFALEIKAHHKQAQTNEGLPDRIARLRKPGTVTVVFS